jgi:hypothetical protein
MPTVVLTLDVWACPVMVGSGYDEWRVLRYVEGPWDMRYGAGQPSRDKCEELLDLHPLCG